MVRHILFRIPRRSRELSTAGEDFGEAFQLFATDRGLNIRHPVIESELWVIFKVI